MKIRLHPSLILGTLLSIAAVLILVVNTLPHAKQPPVSFTDVPDNFQIVIPKYLLKVPVSQNIDPFDQKAYDAALTKGAASAKESVKPDEKGKIFIFAHSSSGVLDKNPYGDIFKNLGNLSEGDEILLDYKNKQYSFRVDKKVVVSPQETDYLEGSRDEKVVYLMTCWPPGTNLMRMIILAKPAALKEI